MKEILEKHIRDLKRRVLRAHTRAHTHTHTHTRAHTHKWKQVENVPQSRRVYLSLGGDGGHPFRCPRMHIYTCAYTRMYVSCVCVRAFSCPPCACMLQQANTHTHTHTHTHTQMREDSGSGWSTLEGVMGTYAAAAMCMVLAILLRIFQAFAGV